VGRFSGLAAVLVAVVYALFFIQKVLYSFLLTETMATYVGISIVIGLVWGRANRWGAASSAIVALLTNFSLYHLKNERLDYWDPNIFLASLVAGILSLVVVSLFTPPESGARVASFFTRLETPSDLGTEKANGQSSVTHVPQEGAQGAADSVAETSRWAAERGRQLLLVNLLHLRRGACGVSFFKAYHDDLKGLAIGSALSVAIVVGLWLLLKL
jgi:hypothetical protein